MKALLITAFCFIFASAAFAQVPAVENPVAVEQIFLAKDNGEGKAGEEAENFLTTDVPIFCVVQLTSSQPVTVKMNFVAVKVDGVKAETKVVTVSYKTNGKQDRVNFTGKPEKTWTAGSYRIDVFLDDKLATTRAFEIRKSSVAIPNSLPASGFVETKPKPKRRVPKKN